MIEKYVLGAIVVIAAAALARLLFRSAKGDSSCCKRCNSGSQCPRDAVPRKAEDE